MSPTNEPTTDYRASTPEGAAPAGRIVVAPAPGAGLTPITDLRSILHRRLRFFCPLFCLSSATLAAWQLKRLFEAGHVSRDRIDFAVYACAFGLSAALTGVLWGRPSLSVRQLRTVEVLFFGAAFALWTWVHAAVYPTLRLSHPPRWFGFIVANAVSLPWSLIMIVYGIFIPNTWRRCAAVVGVLAVTPVVISVTTGLAAEATEGHSRRDFFVPLGVQMAFSAAIAIYGSHRIEVLRQVAVAARRLGQYELTRRLGAGGMGVVYLASHVLLRRPCAVKLIRPDRAADAHTLARFEREVQATAKLTHPNTVQVFDYGHAEDGTFYYAMEYLPGLTLGELVRRHGPLPPERAVHLLRQVAGALSEAHAAGLIHRDIKPGNVITCERGGLHDVAKLLDFGLVRAYAAGGGADHLSREGAVVGTPAFMSPEQADGKDDLDARSDIYSVGAVAYFLLTGRPPFVRPTPLQTLIAHACDPPVPPGDLRAGVPADLQAVVLRCLEKDPARRPPDARSLDAALARCQAAGGWTEERAAAWWHGQAGSVDGASPEAEATTKGA